MRAYVQDPNRGRPRKRTVVSSPEEQRKDISEDELEEIDRGYIDLERHRTQQESSESSAESSADDTTEDDMPPSGAPAKDGKSPSQKDKDAAAGRVVDVVMSDMSAPWEQTEGFGKRSVSNPFSRMMNTSGMAFRDHAGSMVCIPLYFASILSLRASSCTEIRTALCPDHYILLYIYILSESPAR